MSIFIKKQILLLVTLISAVFLTSCSKDIKNTEADILFSQIEHQLQEPNKQLEDSLINTLRSYNLVGLDSFHTKAFWYDAYNFFLEESVKNSSGYIDFDALMNEQILVAGDTMTTSTLINKISSFKDERIMFCLDYHTVTCYPSNKIIISGQEGQLDSLCHAIVNDNTYIRVKSDINKVFYPEHLDWNMALIDQKEGVKSIILKYHLPPDQLKDYQFVRYPFSYKLRI